MDDPELVKKLIYETQSYLCKDCGKMLGRGWQDCLHCKFDRIDKLEARINDLEDNLESLSNQVWGYDH